MITLLGGCRIQRAFHGGIECDIGIVGKDTLLEESRNLYEMVDLGFGKCKMCVCGFPEAKELLQHRELIRVATKYPNIAKKSRSKGLFQKSLCPGQNIRRCDFLSFRA